MTTTSPAGCPQHSLSSKTRIVVASENQGKIRELRSLIGDIAEVVDLTSFGLTLPEEVGNTFAENATEKAVFVCQATGCIVVADDSGLEVDALDGLPGVRTARYAGENATDHSNREKLLRAMEHVPENERRAHFVSVVAIAHPDTGVTLESGRCDGAIARAERGVNGFGYDSIFSLADGRTMAELSADEKNAISHRGRAMRSAVPRLQEMCRGRVELPC